jgi:phosphoenolpyruvate-protein phosphotransferase (PTS system enzyme I)
MSDDIKKTVVLKGIGVSPGIAIGKASFFDSLDSQIAFYKLRDKSFVSKEVKRFRTALAESIKQLREVKAQMTTLEGMDPLYIIDVHIMILKDRSFIKRTIQNIREECINAEWAVKMTVERYRGIFEKMEDEYLRGRISDVQYAGQRILRNLTGAERRPIMETGEDVIVVATDLSPADTAQMKIDRVQGFVTDMGGKTSHTAIVACSIEIPAVVGLEKVTRVVRTNDDLIIDGIAGLVIINPDPEILRRYEVKKRDYQEARKELLEHAKLPAVTTDNRRVEIGCNIEFVEELPSAIAHGAEGIGLYRTEFIYINREQLPSEEEHFASYRNIIGVPGLEWATIRTFDLGGDKFFSNPKLAKEMNPQMGLRAIRFCLKEIPLFKMQLRAIIRASHYAKTRVLFPMISGIEEIQETKRIFNEVKEELKSQNEPVGEDIEIGVMIEVPSAVIIADKLAKEVDFFSIGTNDLIQYSLAIDRINEQVTYLYEPLHPAVLRLIKQVVDVGHQAGIRVAMCGEMAGEPLYTLILLAMDLDELSMNALAIPRVKKIIRASSLKESQALLREVMSFSSATEIRRYVEDYMEKRFPEEFLSDPRHEMPSC